MLCTDSLLFILQINKLFGFNFCRIDKLASPLDNSLEVLAISIGRAYINTYRVFTPIDRKQE